MSNMGTVETVETVETVAATETVDMANVSQAIDRYAELAAMVKAAEEEQKRLRAVIMEAHKSVGATSIEGSAAKSVMVAETVRVSVDNDRLAKELPDIFQQYAKETRIAATNRIVAHKPKVN